MAGTTLADLDPLERERLRQAVQQYGGDRVLLELDDEALDGALGLTARLQDGTRVPTLTGLLLVLLAWGLAIGGFVWWLLSVIVNA